MRLIKFLLPVVIFHLTNKSAPAQQLKPGDIAPNAKAIDAEYLFPFSMGAAIVQKGTAYGLIDMAGNFIVPYNKYRKISALYGFGGYLTSGGIFLLDNEMGAVNSKGKLITEAFPKFRWSEGSDDGKLIKAFEKPLYLDAEGRQYLLKQYLQHIVDGIGIVTESSRSGYKNLKDEWIVKPIYDFAGPFSEGMACVAKRDEFGILKYGFIDKTGKEIIPPMYTLKPDDFHGGLARVTPRNNSEFKQAYIDKKGNLVQKMNAVIFYTYIGNGFYLEDLKYTRVMDSLGNVMTHEDFLRSLGVTLNAPTEKGLNMAVEKVTDLASQKDERICFTRIFKESGRPNLGTVNLRTKAVMEGTFEASTSLRYYDPVSKLAFAKFFTTRNFQDKTPPREGYVNEQGIFVIIKGEASKW